MDLKLNGVDCELEFWPIEHPIEPPDEDRPVKCPIPHSSAVMNDRRMQEDLFSESSWKRTELSAPMNKERTVVMAAEPPVRAVRKKRHHTHTASVDQTLTPLMRMPPLYPLPTQSAKIFKMLQHIN